MLQIAYFVTLSEECLFEPNDTGVVQLLNDKMLPIFVPFILEHLLDGYLLISLCISGLTYSKSSIPSIPCQMYHYQQPGSSCISIVGSISGINIILEVLQLDFHLLKWFVSSWPSEWWAAAFS